MASSSESVRSTKGNGFARTLPLRAVRGGHRGCARPRENPAGSAGGERPFQGVPELVVGAVDLRDMLAFDQCADDSLDQLLG